MVDLLVELSGQRRSEGMGSSIDFGFLTEMVGNEPAVLEEYLGDYRLIAVNSHDLILNAAAHNNLDELIALAHKFKSTSRFVGAKKLGSICDKIERAGKAPETINMKQLIAEFTEEYNAVITDIDNFLNGIPAKQDF